MSLKLLMLLKAQANKTPLNRGALLLTETELANDLAVSINVFTIKVVKKTAALSDHFQQATSAAVIVLVLAQVFR
jgi:hypothetical protein